MRIKLLFLVLFLSSVSSFAQNVGDYRSNPTVATGGNYFWNNAANWQVYQITPTIGWVTATNYPGITNGTYNVEIRIAHVITLPNGVNNLPNTFGTLTINGQLKITSNQNAYLNATAVIVTKDVGSIQFSGQSNLYLPADTSLTVYPANNTITPTYAGGLLIDGSCSNSQRIYIGTIWLSSCQGAGNGPMLSFSGLMSTNGSLTGILDVDYECDKATITPRHIGLITGTNRKYQMIVRNPANNIILDTGLITYNPTSLQNYTIDIPQLDIYIIELHFEIDYSGVDYENNRTIDLYSYIKWNGTSWNPSYLSPTNTIRAVLDGNYNTTSNGSFSACSLQINNSATVTIEPNTYIETEDNIVNNGTLNIQNKGSLVQKDNAATFTGTGTNTVTRVSRGMKPLDYVYLGSPVFNSQPLSLASTTHFDRFFIWNITGAQTGIWSAISATPAPGNGYISRVNPGHVSPNTTQMVFSGNKLNSGLITVTANVFDGGNINTDSGNSVLLANPYPSAISATALFDNHVKIEKLLFWTSVTVYLGSGQYQFSDYAILNRSGGTAPTTLNADITGLTPEFFIASGQGFFAQLSGDTTIAFNNSMRVRENNSQFFRMADADANEAVAETEKHRLWINLNNGKDAYRQMLVGYIEGASNGFDNQYDGTSFTTNEIDIYTILENKELAIQGRGLPFNDSDSIPVGYRVTNAGHYSITLSETDGLFTEFKEVYIKDKTTNTFHNLKKGSYEFHAQTGTFNNRFEIHFKEQSKENNEIVSENNILIYGANGALNVNSYETTIQTVEVYDLLGKLIYTANEINGNQYVSTAIKTANPFLIARVTLTNNQVVTKKIIIN